MGHWNKWETDNINTGLVFVTGHLIPLNAIPCVQKQEDDSEMNSDDSGEYTGVLH
jgi:hypothetical protein